MMIKKYYSHDLRSAVLKIRNELGVNSVTFSHLRESDGVEVIAGIYESSFGGSSINYSGNTLDRSPELWECEAVDNAAYDVKTRSTKIYCYENQAARRRKFFQGAGFGNESCTASGCLPAVEKGSRKLFITREYLLETSRTKVIQHHDFLTRA